MHNKARAIAEGTIGIADLHHRLDVGIVIVGRLDVGFGAQVTNVSFLKFQRLNRAAVIAGHDVFNLDTQVLFELGENRLPTARHFRG